MTARGMSAAALAQSRASANQPVHLVACYFDDITIRYTDAYRNVVWNGDTFTAAGHLLEFSGITESVELRVTQAEISLSGVEQSFVAIVLQKQYVDRRIVVWKAFLAPGTDALVIDPVPLLDGRMDAPTIDEDPSAGTCTVKLGATSHWVDFERRPGRHTNDTEQQSIYPGDRFFEYASQVAKQIVWGRASGAAANVPPAVINEVPYDWTSSGNWG